jgi:hypothetical protein
MSCTSQTWARVGLSLIPVLTVLNPATFRLVGWVFSKTALDEMIATNAEGFTSPTEAMSGEDKLSLWQYMSTMPPVRVGLLLVHLMVLILFTWLLLSTQV